MTEQPPGVGPEPGGYGYPPPPPPPPGNFNVSPSGGLGPPQQAGYPPPPLGATGSSGTNRFAIFSLISSAVGWVCCGIGSIAGIILGVMALKRIKQTNEGGRGLAIAGIIIGSLSLAALALFWGGFFVAAYNDHSKNTHHQDGQSAAVITAVPQAVSGISLA
ncbi:MAG: hypothetical protein QOD58_1300 [Mycobacterium sp.]|nr:hypothetical protein [Mycobacterium sp.]